MGEEVTTGTKIPVSRIKPHPLNPRVDFTKLPPQDKNAPENDDPVTNRLVALSESIKKSGGHPFNPILVRPWSGGYEIVCVRPGAVIPGDYKAIEDLSEGDRVVGYTGLQLVKHTMRRDYQGKLVRIEASGLLPIEVTPKHPLLVSNSISKPRGTARIIKGFSSVHWVEARNLQKKSRNVDGHYLVVPRLQGSYEGTEIDLKSYVRGARGFTLVTKKGRPFSFPLNQETAWLLGLYVAEGSSGVSAATIYLNKNETEIADAVLRICGALGYRARAIEKQTVIAVVITSTILARALRVWCGKKAPTKQVPEFLLLHKNSTLIEAFLNGYLTGDGCKRVFRGRHILEADTVSLKLALQLQLLSTRLGKFFHLYRNRSAGTGFIQGRPVKLSERYLLRYVESRGRSPTRARVREEYILVPIRKITQVRYKGPVYNLSTPDNTFLISNAVTHNCGHTRFKAMTEVLGYGELEVGKDLVVREMDDEAVVRVMVDDNLRRWQYKPAEFAEALKLLVNTCGLSIKEAARQYNVDHKWLLRILKVSELPDRVKAKVVWGKAKTTRSSLKPGVSRPRPTRSKGIITVHHAEELAKLETNRQKEAVGLAIEKHSLTVKETARVVGILEKNPWEPLDDIVRVVRAAGSVTSNTVSTLDVEFNDSRVAGALDAAARAAKVSPSEFAAQKIVEGLVNDGYLKRDILRQNEYRDWYEKEVLSAQA